jgi:hypothetical protein
MCWQIFVVGFQGGFLENLRNFEEGWIFLFLAAGYCFAKAFKLAEQFREGLTFREIVQMHDHPRR